ncbi:MAG: hypothetical protein AAF914_10630 [Pseudomonadota bacterium]
MIRRAGAALVAMACAGPLFAQVVERPSAWEGDGVQDTGSSWTIAIEFDHFEVVRISYPSLGCSGLLERIGTSVAGGGRYLEVITDDPDQTCINGGFVELNNMPDKTIEYLWFYPNRPNSPGGSGIVARVD